MGFGALHIGKRLYYGLKKQYFSWSRDINKFIIIVGNGWVWVYLFYAMCNLLG